MESDRSHGTDCRPPKGGPRMHWLAYADSVTMPLGPVRLAFPHHDSRTHILSPPKDEEYSSGALDDFVIEQPPELNVDYLSHSWESWDLWAARQYIRKRKKNHSHYFRLENALWRAWWRAEKVWDNFPSQKINWDKDTDIIWLYGPLLSRLPVPAASPISQSSLENPSVPRKSALKRRSSTWLRYSISKYGHQRLRMELLQNRSIVFPSQFHHSPRSPANHVHFNNIVEQCVFLDSEAKEITHFTEGAFYETQCRLRELRSSRNMIYSGCRLWQSQPLEELTYLQVQAPTLLRQSSDFLRDLSQDSDNPFQAFLSSEYQSQEE